MPQTDYMLCGVGLDPGWGEDGVLKGGMGVGWGWDGMGVASG